jgi:aryl-alcohol dehydrogenase-like predicted oxidoreductase
MNYRKLGDAGVKLSEPSLGAWVTRSDDSEAYVKSNAETVMVSVNNGILKNLSDHSVGE